jgi:hypothetical protein
MRPGQQRNPYARQQGKADDCQHQSHYVEGRMGDCLVGKCE